MYLFTSSFMGIETHVTSRSRYTSAFSERDMCTGLFITIGLAHSEIDHEQRIGGVSFGTSNEKIVGLHISVDQAKIVYHLEQA